MGEPGRVIRACPACGDDTAPQVGAGAGGFDTVAGGRTFSQPPYAIRRCDTCGLHFKSVTLSANELAAYYALLDSGAFEDHGDFPTDAVLRRRLADLAGGSRVLDFGCSTGRVLRHESARLRCFGVEPNQTAAGTASSRGIRILTERELQEWHEGFDAILLADVYEHLPEPVPLLELIAGKLDPGGWLAIVSGNADAIRTRSRLAEYWYFRLPGHLLMSSDRHLSWLAARLDLNLGSVHHCSHYTTPLAERWRQDLQAFAYDAFRTDPRGWTARLLRRLPRLSAAERWPTAPALMHRADHVVAFFHRSQD